MLGADLNLGTDAADRSCDGRARDGRQHRDRRAAVSAHRQAGAPQVVRDRPRRCRCDLPRRSGLGSQSSRSRYQRRIGWLTPVREQELAICGNELLGVEDRKSASTHQFGSVGAEDGRECIEAIDKIVVELHQYLTSCHDHMLSHMVTLPVLDDWSAKRGTRPAATVMCRARCRAGRGRRTRSPTGCRAAFAARQRSGKQRVTDDAEEEVGATGIVEVHVPPCGHVLVQVDGWAAVSVDTAQNMKSPGRSRPSGRCRSRRVQRPRCDAGGELTGARLGRPGGVVADHDEVLTCSGHRHVEQVRWSSDPAAGTRAGGVGAEQQHDGVGLADLGTCAPFRCAPRPRSPDVGTPGARPEGLVEARRDPACTFDDRGGRGR